MKRVLSFILLIALLLCGCSSQPAAPETEADSFGATFVDDLGRTVTVRDPQRVACLLGSWLIEPMFKPFMEEDEEE